MNIPIGAQYKLLNLDGSIGAYYRKTLHLFNDGVIREGLQYFASTESWQGSTDRDRDALMAKLVPIEGVSLDHVAYDRATIEKLAEIKALTDDDSSKEKQSPRARF